jgi:hypothetical protein
LLPWFEKLDIPLVCDLVERWPTLEELQKVSGEELRASCASTTAIED